MTDFEEHLGHWDRLAIAFSSRPDRFEWGGTLSRMGINYVVLRDSTERWYRHGIAGIGDMWATVEYVQRMMCRHSITMTLGLSSGAYAALLYGHLAEVDGVVAISPITGKGDAVKEDFEPKWHHRIEHGPEHPPVVDLKLVFGNRGPWTQVNAFVSDGDSTELDRQMCERIGVEPKLVTGYSHSGLAKHLRDDGTVAGLLLSS